ncbi:MAG: HAMP domain-containing sensor histidine kinase [Bacteroidota bacterium]
MRFKINSIKNRILIGFLSVILGVLILGVISLIYLNRINSIRTLGEQLNSLQTTSLHLIKADNDFFDIGAIDKLYFTSKESAILNKREKLWAQIQKSLLNFQTERGISTLQKELSEIDSTLKRYNKRFQKLTELIYIRGFKDYGMEGKMRVYAHKLENSELGFSLSDVLSLRRHEKDFFLRNDSNYIKLLNRQAQQMLNSLPESRTTYDSAITVIQSYVNTFNALVSVQSQIGLNSNEGLRNELNNLTMTLDRQFVKLSSHAEHNFANVSNRIIFLFSSALIIITVLTILWSNFISKKLSRPIKKLDDAMRLANKNDLKGLINVTLKNPDSEIEHLSTSFTELMKKAKVQMKEIKDKSSALEQQNNELKKVNNQLDSFIYSTAHDLRSPLASLLGLVHLSELEQNSDHNNYLGLMKGSIQKMDNFIKDVVAYSKNKKLEINKEDLNINDLILDVFKDHQYMSEVGRIERKIDVRGNEIIHSDLGRLKIIFNNLISNAIRYADFNKKKCWVSIRVDVTHSSINIIFSDNGIGIEDTHLKKIFNMFFRASESSSGSGLGLFILLETVKKLSGSVEVSSEPKVGTSFFINIPQEINEVQKHKNRQINVFS